MTGKNGAVRLGGVGARTSVRGSWPLTLGCLEQSLLPSLGACMPVRTRGTPDMEWVEARNANAAQHPGRPTKPHRK